MKNILLAYVLISITLTQNVLAEDLKNSNNLPLFIQKIQQDHPAFARFKAAENKANAQAKSMGSYIYNPEFSFEAESKNDAEEIRIYGIAQTLDISGKNFVQKRIGKQLAVSKKAEIYQQRENYIGNIIKAIAEYESANKVMKLAKEQAVLMDKFVRIGEKRSKAGDVGSTELSLARLAGAQSQSILADATASFETAYAELNSMCNCSPKTAPKLNAEPPELILSEDLEFIAKGLPAYRSAQASYEAAKQNISLKRRELVPDPTLNIGAGKDGNTSTVTFGLSIPIPVFKTGSPALNEAKAESIQTGATFNELKTRLLADLKRKSRIYKGHKKALSSWRKLAQPSLDSYTKTLEKQWKSGELSASDYLLQVKQGIETAMTGAEIKSHAWGAWADYMALTGKIENWTNTTISKEIK